MSVRSRTTIRLLPRRVTSAMQGLEGALQGLCAGGRVVVVGVGFVTLGVVRVPEVVVPLVGEPQAPANSAATASTRNHPAVLVFMQR